MEKLSPIKETLFYAMRLIGFNPKDFSKDSLHIIIDNIINNQSDISINKFREAFELGANGKLDIDLNTYQNFNTLYVSNVLGAYRRFKINKSKLEKFALPEPKEKLSWTMDEKKTHFEWLRDEVFLGVSKRNGKSGEFPEIIIASWKDIYDYMTANNMIKIIRGKELVTRVRECLRIDKAKESNPLGNIIDKSRNDSVIPTSFYKHEVKDYFITNRDKLV